MTAQLPYFDLLFKWRASDDARAAVFSRFLHWGLWWPADRPDGSPQDFMRAMERFNAHVLDWAQLLDGQDILDVGCGLGGTLASIAAMLPATRLTGLNIDPRQIEAARTICRPPPHGTLEFVEGSAMRMPFADASFDRVLAIECAFHFPSRLEFLREASRTLRPGGRLVMSDFIPLLTRGPDRLFDWLEGRAEKGFGQVSTRWPDGTYAEMATAAGLRPIADENLTKATLPTYAALIGLYSGCPDSSELLKSTKLLSMLSRLGLFRYHLLAFEKPTQRP